MSVLLLAVASQALLVGVQSRGDQRVSHPLRAVRLGSADHVTNVAMSLPTLTNSELVQLQQATMRQARRLRAPALVELGEATLPGSTVLATEMPPVASEGVEILASWDAVEAGLKERVLHLKGFSLSPAGGVITEPDWEAFQRILERVQPTAVVWDGDPAPLEGPVHDGEKPLLRDMRTIFTRLVWYALERDEKLHAVGFNLASGGWNVETDQASWQQMPPELRARIHLIGVKDGEVADIPFQSWEALAVFALRQTGASHVASLGLASQTGTEFRRFCVEGFEGVSIDEWAVLPASRDRNGVAETQQSVWRGVEILVPQIYVPASGQWHVPENWEAADARWGTEAGEPLPPLES